MRAWLGAAVVATVAAGGAMSIAPGRARAREAGPAVDVPAADVPAGDASPPVPACINWWQQSRYRPYGYDHVVHIKSSCAKPADCMVSTDVAPSPVKTLVPAGAKVEVITFVLSPASAFTAKVDCKLRP